MSESVCWVYVGRRITHGLKVAFDVITRTMLDNPICSTKIARRYEERNTKVEIIPNPFEGVNTHFWETRPTSSVLSLLFVPPIVHKRRNERGTGGKGPACGIQCF